MKEEETKTEETVKPKIERGGYKKSRIKFFIAGLLVIVAIAIGLYIGYKKLNNDPMSIYKDAINETYKFLSNGVKEIDKQNFKQLDFSNNPATFSLNAKLDSNIKELKNFTGYNYSINGGLDIKNKKLNAGVNISEDNASVLSLIFSIINDNMYLQSKELYDKVIDLGTEDSISDVFKDFELTENPISFNSDNYEYILKEMKIILINSLDKNKFTMDEETIKLNGKKYDAKKALYNLDKENMERTIKYFKAEILKDEKLLKAISESLGYTTDELKNGLEKEVDMSRYVDTKVILYTDRFNTLIAGALFIDTDKVLSLECVNDTILIEMNYETSNLVINCEKDKTTITIYDNEDKVFNLVAKNDKEDVKMDYELSINGNTFSGVIELKNIKDEKDSIKADFYFSINTSYLGETISLSLDGSYSVKIGEFDTLDSSNSIKIEDINEAESLEMLVKLNTILEKFGLKDLLSSLM